MIEWPNNKNIKDYALGKFTKDDIFVLERFWNSLQINSINQFEFRNQCGIK